ncbi:HlyD family efflux transporter periplasmic adaptor subunit [Candidatus Pelagibacter sp.]|nr:HlyD family efflux transporter periplasmic adaptor subunit [Candidatus Pelagibacter sp.]
MLKKIFIFLYLTVNSTIMVSAEEIDYNARALVGATEQVLITSEIAAKINNIGFTNGEPFLKGDILITFDCELFEAQREVIQANLDSADVQLKNDKELFNMRSIGELQYELSINGLKKAKAELLIANLNVKRCKIIAPYNGKVMDVYTNEYASIEQRQPLMEIVGDGLLEAITVVPSNWLSWLKSGVDVKILIDETGDELEAKIINLGATVDAASQTIELKLQFKEKYETLIPGMSGVVRFERR